MNEQELKYCQNLMFENNTLRDELEAERFIIDQLTKLSTAELIGDGALTLLKDLGEYTCADRSYIFEVNEDRTCSNTYEWCDDGITPQIDNLKGIPFESMPHWIDIFLNGENILIEDLDDIRTLMPQEYGLLKFQNIRTLIAFPLSVHDKFLGFVGVDNPNMSKSKLIRRMLALLGQHIGSMIHSYQNERTQIEMAAARSRQAYKRDMEKILSRAEMGMWTIHTQEGQASTLAADPTMHILLGTDGSTSPEGCYTTWFDHIDSHYVDAVLDFQAEIIRSGYSEITYPWHHPVRGKIWVRCGGVLFENTPENGISIRGYHQDITKTRENELKYQSLLYATSQIYYAIYHIDLKKDKMEKISSSNQTYKAVSGQLYASEQIQGFCKKYVMDSYQQKFSAFFDLSTLAERLSGKMFISMEYPNHQGIWRRATFIAQNHEDSTLPTNVLYVTQIIDESKQKELTYQRKLENAIDEAKRANAAKSDFLSRMSHDIRTPINGIMGMLDIASKVQDQPEKVQDCYEKMRFSASHLLTLINDILDMNKLESGELSNDQKVFNIPEMIRGCWDVLEYQAEQSGITGTQIDLSGITYPDVIGSPLHFRQVLMNLLTNAIKYNKPGGSIHISTKLTQKICDTVYYQFTISDTGIGMSQEFLAHIFEPFAQEYSGARTNYQGTGLGMAIVHRLVQAMGGDIQIESQKDIGSTFTIILPFTISDVSDTPQVSVSDTASVSLDGLKILVVEDNDLNLEIVTYLLEEEGVTVTSAKNGKEACRIFLESEPGEFDLILMDIMMPVMNGLEATRYIRDSGHPNALSIPIIAMTANAFADDVQKSRQAGMNEHLAKPLDPNTLKKAIAAYRTKEQI